MAEEVLVKEILSNEMINSGAELTRLLDQANLVVNASLWLYIPESDVWRLIIASPEVSQFGPKKVYQKILPFLSHEHEKKLHIGLKNISVVESDDPLIKLLRTAIVTGMGISGIRFSKNSINGHFIEDSYIYRVT
jgi:hypothetical protein